MTCEMPLATSPSAGVPGTKGGIAIGIGANSPSVTLKRVWANAGGTARPPSTPRLAMPEMIWRRLGRNDVMCNLSRSVISSDLA